jgi:biopolymer transport protein ExbD
MPFIFSCPQCGKRLMAKQSMAGREKSCPKCHASVTVPMPSETAQPAEAKIEDAPQQTDHPLLLVPSRPHPQDLIDMTAMVDIVFFLLIFFLVTSMQSLEAVINLPTPQAPSQAAENVRQVPDFNNDPRYLVVTIDDDDAIWIEGEQVFGELDLRAKLRAAKSKDEQLSGLMVNGAPEATHGTFVMVLDAGAGAGMKELLFSVTGQTENPDTG